MISYWSSIVIISCLSSIVSEIRFIGCKAVFLPFLPTPVFVALARGFPWHLGYESWNQKFRMPELPDGEYYPMSLSSQGTRYRLVMDEHTDGTA